MELLYLCSPLTYCLVYVLQPCVHLLGRGLRPALPVRQVQHLLDPLFWPSMLSTVFLYLVSFFPLSLPLILFNHATIYIYLSFIYIYIWASWAHIYSVTDIQVACSNLAQVCSVPLTFICLKEAWTMWTEKCLTVVARHKAPASLRWRIMSSIQFFTPL